MRLGEDEWIVQMILVLHHMTPQLLPHYRNYNTTHFIYHIVLMANYGHLLTVLLEYFKKMYENLVACYSNRTMVLIFRIFN